MKKQPEQKAAEPTFTPGPWAAETSVGGHTIITCYAGMQSLAKVLLHSGNLSGHERTAMLIAAAPELYESVREFVELYANVSDLISAENRAKVERARAALAKANAPFPK